ncbi:MAG: hypothetical protein N3D11_06870 [Candidatus Sumerlaeia bacterium]|nr:hypothetical protein [Candidatus Sumerlaeia bacterium]
MKKLHARHGAILAALIALPLVVAAQPPGRGGMGPKGGPRGFGPREGRPVAPWVGERGEQPQFRREAPPADAPEREQMRRVAEQTRKESAEIAERLQKLHAELRDLMAEKEINEDRVMRVAEEIGKLETEAHKARLRSAIQAIRAAGPERGPAVSRALAERARGRGPMMAPGAGMRPGWGRGPALGPMRGGMPGRGRGPMMAPGAGMRMRAGWGRGPLAGEIKERLHQRLGRAWDWGARPGPVPKGRPEAAPPGPMDRPGLARKGQPDRPVPPAERAAIERRDVERRLMERREAERREAERGEAVRPGPPPREGERRPPAPPAVREGDRGPRGPEGAPRDPAVREGDRGPRGPRDPEARGQGPAMMRQRRQGGDTGQPAPEARPAPPRGPREGDAPQPDRPAPAPKRTDG